MNEAKLCLNMIVKNEAQNIERCLRSVAPFISSWYICDTESTDDTPKIIEQFFADRHIPGQLHSLPFVNFGTTRNEAMSRASKGGNSYDYLLFADADMELIVEDGNFRQKLTDDAYALRQRNSISYFNTRLVKVNANASYCGVTHEYLRTSSPATRLEGAWFKDHTDGANRAGKFKRDIQLLREDLKADPSNSRSVFYLAQSLRDDGQFIEARETYRQHVSMESWDEEKWYSLWQIASLSERVSDTPQAVEHAYIMAYAARPTRAEPLVDLARFHRLRLEYGPAFLYAQAASQTPYPSDDVLFVDEATYAWRRWDEVSIAGWYVGRQDDGRAASRKLIDEAKFPAHERPRIEANATFYSSSMTGAA